MIALLYLLPAVLLAVLLVLRRYPGERRLVALSCPERQASNAEKALRLLPRGPRAGIPRGGLLIACSLAVRPPPVSVGVIS